MTRTSTDVDANGTHADSRPVRYAVIDSEGNVMGTFYGVQPLCHHLNKVMPGRMQDDGWDVQAIGPGERV